MKSDVQKCSIFGNFQGETVKLKHNKCQCCRMVRLDLKLTTTNKGICKKCAPLKNEKYYSWCRCIAGMVQWSRCSAILCTDVVRNGVTPNLTILKNNIQIPRTISCIRNLGKRKHSLNDFQNITRHKIWVQHLTNNTSDGNITAKKLKSALDWVNTATIDYDRLYSRVKLYVHRQIQKRYHVDGEYHPAQDKSKRQRVHWSRGIKADWWLVTYMQPKGKKDVVKNGVTPNCTIFRVRAVSKNGDP